MTYCVAWKNKNTVYLISDTAVTIEDNSRGYKPQKNQTSIGEKSYYNKNVFVEEWIHKQFRIQDNFIITYAGEVDTVIEIIKNLRNCYDPNEPMQSFELALDSVRDVERPKNIQFLFGFKKDNIVKLFTYNLENKTEIIEVEEDKIVQIGSLSKSKYYDLAIEMFNRHIKNLAEPTQQFYQFLSFFQHIGIHDNTLKKYAGGIYCGLYLDLNGVHWAEDTSIIIYNRNLQNSTQIQIEGWANYFVRNDCLVISSSFTKQREFFIDTTDNVIYQSEELQRKIDYEHSNLNPNVISFLASDERIMATVKTNGHNKNAYFIIIKKNGNYQIALNSNFLKIIKGEYFQTKNLFYIFWDEIIPTKSKAPISQI